MKNLYVNTPLVRINNLSSTDKNIYFKMDAFQPSGSFKLRGMQYACLDAVENGAKKLLSSSGGNAGLAVAYVGQKQNIPTTVVLPTSTPQSTIEKLESYNATVIVEGAAWDDAHQHCLSMCQNDDTFAYIPPFDLPKLWEGHGTIVDELKAELDTKPDLIIVSVGGGGLMNGIVEGLIRNGWEDVHILAVETHGADSLYQAVEAGKLITLDDITSVAKSLGAKQVATKTLENAKQFNITPYRVTDERAVAACITLANENRILVEPACGAALSVVYDNLDILKPYKSIVVEVCGGSSVNLDILAQWKSQYNL